MLRNKFSATFRIKRIILKSQKNNNQSNKKTYWRKKDTINACKQTNNNTYNCNYT